MTTKHIPVSEPRRHNGKLVLTAKDVASAIAFAKDRQGFPKALRQVKHWTDNGLLQAITDLSRFHRLDQRIAGVIRSSLGFAGGVHGREIHGDGWR